MKLVTFGINRLGQFSAKGAVQGEPIVQDRRIIGYKRPDTNGTRHDTPKDQLSSTQDLDGILQNSADRPRREAISCRGEATGVRNFLNARHCPTLVLTNILQGTEIAGSAFRRVSGRKIAIALIMDQ